MPLNPAEANFFESLAKQAAENPPTPLAEQSLDDFRKGSEFFTAFMGKSADVSVTNTFVPTRDGHQIPLRIYHDDLPENSPVLIMYPGCGYVIDLFEPNAIACSRIAKNSGIKVILVNFRLAPEHPLPGPIYDAYDATKYVVTHEKKFNINPDKVFIGGLSSGAHCAAVISNLARRDKTLKIHHQILLNGSYDLIQSNHAFDAYEREDKICTREAVDFIFKLWSLPCEYKNPLISPAYEPDLSGLPKTTILVGEYDGIRNDSETYYEKMSASGNAVQKIVLSGQSHNTFIMRGVMSDGEDPAAVIAHVIRENL